MTTFMTTEKFLKQVKRISPTFEITGEYISLTEPIQIRCKKCQRVFKPKAEELLSGVVCPKCKNQKTHKTHRCQTKVEPTNKSAKVVRCVETGKVYPTQTAAARDAKTNRRSIARCLTGEQITAGGYHWETEQ